MGRKGERNAGDIIVEACADDKKGDGDADGDKELDEICEEVHLEGG